MHILAYSGIFRYKQAYSGIFSNVQELFWYYSGIFWTLCNSGIFRTLVYSEPRHIQNQRHIQNPGLFTTLGYSEPEAYSEPCQTSKMEHFEKQLYTLRTAIIIFVSYNYFRNISFSNHLVHEINKIFLMQM